MITLTKIKFFLLESSERSISKPDEDGMKPRAGFITLGYRGTFASGRGDLADVKFRKLNRILVRKKVATKNFTILRRCLNFTVLNHEIHRAAY